jgi:hypothetical protein
LAVNHLSLVAGQASSGRKIIGFPLMERNILRSPAARNILCQINFQNGEIFLDEVLATTQSWLVACENTGLCVLFLQFVLRMLM